MCCCLYSENCFVFQLLLDLGFMALLRPHCVCLGGGRSSATAAPRYLEPTAVLLLPPSTVTRAPRGAGGNGPARRGDQACLLQAALPVHPVPCGVGRGAVGPDLLCALQAELDGGAVTPPGTLGGSRLRMPGELARARGVLEAGGRCRGAVGPRQGRSTADGVFPSLLPWEHLSQGILPGAAELGPSVRSGRSRERWEAAAERGRCMAALLTHTG